MTKDALAEVTDDPKKEVPRLRSLRHTNHQEVVEEGKPPEVEPVYDTVPRDEWIETESAFDAERKLNQAISQVDSTGLVVAGVTETTSGHHPQKTIEVRYIERKKPSGKRANPNVSFEDISEQIPSKVSGTAGAGDNAVTVRDIPVTTKKVTHELQAHYDSDYESIPGGCSMECAREGLATTCTPAYDNDLGEYVIVTAGHAIEDVEPGYNVGQPEFDYIELIGQSEDAYYMDDSAGHTLFDAATIDLNSGTNYEYALADDTGGYDEEIYGVVAWDTIEYFQGNSDYILTKQGRETGRKEGYIDWASSNAKVFETTADSDGGDSGGPHFNIDGDKALIAGVHNYSSGENAGATSIEAVTADGAWGDFNLIV
jgi:hypothetical protein